MVQDALRVKQLAVDTREDVWLLEDLSEAGSETWENGLRENMLVLRAEERRVLGSSELTDLHASVLFSFSPAN